MKKAPHEPQTERALVGAMLYGTPANYEAFELLGDVSPEQWTRSPFHDPKAAAVYAGIRSLDRKNGRIDPFTVTEEMRSLGLDKVCTLQDVIGIQADAGSTAVIQGYAKIVTEHYANRELIKLGQDMQSRVYDGEKDSTAIIETLEQQLFALKGLKNSKGVPLGSVVSRVVADATTPQVKIKGVATGIKTLDQITGGFRETNFIILAARTSECKSTAAIAFSLNCALSGKHVVFFSMEMSEEEIVAKYLANLASIDSNAIEQGMVNGYEVPGLQAAGNILRELPITLYCEGAVKADDIRSKVRYHLGKGKVGLVVVDYIQLMNGGKQGTREREVSVSSNALKAIAMDLKPPILGLAQLSRDVVKRGGPPGLIDLRESGSLEQDPNKVIFNYFPDRETAPDSKYEDIENMQFIVAKNRGGKLGTVNAIADKRYSQFKEPDIHVPAF